MTKRDRELAATICAILASNDGVAIPSAEEAIGADVFHGNIAWWTLLSGGWSQCPSAADLAEAESKLRTGFTPRQCQ